MSLTGFAVDLGGTKIAAARIENGRIADRVQEPTGAASQVEGHLDHVAALLERLGFARGAALGLAVTGRVTAAGAWSAVNAGTLPRIDDAPLGRIAGARLGPVRLGNDAAAAVLAEHRLGAGQGVADLAYLTVSTGVGGGLILGGRALRGRDGLAGHLGFVSSPHAHGTCESGRRATVESVAAGRAIASAAAAAGHDLDARGVFAAADAGAGWAEAIVARSAAAIATLAADLRASLGISRVCIGGSIGLAPGYLARVEAASAEEPPLFQPELRPAALGPDSALLGALLLPAVAAE